MRSASNKRRSSRKSKAKKGSARFVYLIIALCVIGLIAGGIALQSSQPTHASTNQYAGIPGPNDWTEETPIQIYNRRNGQWEPMTYGDVGPDMEFIVGNYVYATTPENGSLFLKPEIDISKLTETDQAFDPDNWRMPTPDDIVKVFRSDNSGQQKGHWLLKDVQPDSEVVFQGKVWKWELDVENQRFLVSDTGNVFARVTETHVNFHEGDVLALTVRFDSCGKTGIITGSEEHPFYVLDVEDYVPMVDLKSDMRLKTDNGSLATVVELKPLNESMELYNLTVEHVQNYYIFTSEDDPGVLVHNTGPCDGFVYSPSVQRKTASSSDIYHNFPSSLDADIMSGNPLMVRPDGRQEFIQQGIINNTEGAYHITLGGDRQTIIHRTFVPKSAWDNFANNHGLPVWSNLP